MARLLDLLSFVVPFVVAVGLLVTVHELGHYWVARWCNVKILRFSIGFGRPLWLKRSGRDQTEWVLATIPLGGYVRMLDERDPDARTEDLPRSFNRQSVWKRIAIVLAGPVANFLLASVLYWGLFVQGTPGLRPYTAEPLPGTAAAQAGFKEWDLIRKLNDVPVATWLDVRWLLLKEALKGDSVVLDVETFGGKTVERKLSLAGIGKEDLDKDFLAKVGLLPYRPVLEAVIRKVLPDRPAALAGLRDGDRVVTVDGAPVRDWEDLVTKVSAGAGRPLTFVVQRGMASAEIKVTPSEETDAKGKRVGRIGIESPRLDPELDTKLYTVVRYGPGEAAIKAVAKVGDMSAFSLKMLGKMLTGDLSWRNLSGPITIADYAGQTAKLGLSYYLGFLALVSVSIGVLNLLPVPVLDGGQLVYYLVEIFKGSPVSQRVVEVGQQVGLALLLGLTAFAFYNDIHRLITS